MTLEIKRISFDEILPIWEKFLWPNRNSPIETHSAILFNTYPYQYNTAMFDIEAQFFGAYINNELAGVNSGHLIGDNTYRSRGLYVFDEFRGQSIGRALLSATIDYSVAKNADFCWSIPRSSAIKTYLNAGFKITGDWFNTETSDSNVYVSTVR